MRKTYIDNLRAVTILVVFLFHVFMPYSIGDRWYIQGQGLLFSGIFIYLSWIWIMPLLFAIAGISSRYALERRSTGQYAKERVSKVLVPLIFGLLLIVPIQPYLARLFYCGHANYLYSFTKVTDLSGYDGAFALGHLWFMLFLFIISMVCLPIMVWYKNKGKGTLGDKVPLVLIILMGLIPCVTQHHIFKFINIDGNKSILEYSAYFLLGYFFLSNDNLLEKLEKYRFFLLGLFALYAGFMIFILDGEFFEMASWLAILAILGLGRHYLNFKGKIAGYLSKSSFGIYLFHQSWIVTTAFFIFKVTNNPALQIPLIFLSSIMLTYATYEICKRISVFRWMFGLRKIRYTANAIGIKK